MSAIVLQLITARNRFSWPDSRHDEIVIRNRTSLPCAAVLLSNTTVEPSRQAPGNVHGNHHCRRSGHFDASNLNDIMKFTNLLALMALGVGPTHAASPRADAIIHAMSLIGQSHQFIM